MISVESSQWQILTKKGQYIFPHILEQSNLYGMTSQKKKKTLYGMKNVIPKLPNFDDTILRPLVIISSFSYSLVSSLVYIYVHYCWCLICSYFSFVWKLSLGNDSVQHFQDLQCHPRPRNVTYLFLIKLLRGFSGNFVLILSRVREDVRWVGFLIEFVTCH